MTQEVYSLGKSIFSTERDSHERNCGSGQNLTGQKIAVSPYRALKQTLARNFCVEQRFCVFHQRSVRTGSFDLCPKLRKVFAPRVKVKLKVFLF